MSLIRFIFTGDTSQLDSAAKGAKKQLSELKSEFREGVSTSAKWGAAMAAAGAAVTAHLVNKSLDAVDAQAKLAKSLDTTIKGLDITTVAAGKSGVAFSGVEQATKDLTRRLSQAASGVGPAADALDRLGLSADYLASLPLDQRIGTINQAIDQFIPKAEQAAVAGQLFGEEGSLAMRRIDAATLREAAAEVDRFGLALTEVDAAQIEMANDAMASVSKVVTDLTNKFTAELAPVLTALSNQFLDAADDGTGMAEEVDTAFDSIVRSIAFTLDAIEGLRRSFMVAGQAVAAFSAVVIEKMIGAADIIINGPVDALNTFIRLANKIPNVDLPTMNYGGIGAGVRDALNDARAVTTEGWKAIQETLMEPLPSGQFIEFVAEAKAAGKEAAEAMAAAKVGVDGGEGKSPSKAEEDARKKREEELAKSLEALRTSYMTGQELLAQKLATEQEILVEALDLKAVTQEEFDARMLETAAAYQDGLTDIEKKASDARKKVAQAEKAQKMRAFSDMFANLSSLMNNESRKMFEIGKAAAISDTVISTYSSAQKSYDALAGIPFVGPALGAAAAAAAVLGGMGRVSAIRSQSFGGGGAASAGQSNTQAVNAASTPVAQGGGASAQGPTYTFNGIEEGKLYNGRDIKAALADYEANGGSLVMGS